MYLIAYASLLLALLASLGGGGMALLQLWQGREDYLKAIRLTQYLVAATFLLASALLLHALFWQDYSLEYAASYTDSLLPVFYRITAFWAGQPGSMLFWALCCALCGLAFSLSKSYSLLPGKIALWFWVFFYLNMAFFSLLLTCWSNPFLILSPAPLDGQGLNPLLQNPGMIFHPPLLFLGYALFLIPSCLALAQCLSPEPTLKWFRLTRPYIMLAWIFLTAGIILGAWWAYMELGWGGYWAWDPVENASLLPWLVSTACLHLLAIQKYSSKLGRTTAFLMAFTVISAFFATYLTRSGIIQSVHAFGDGGVGSPLLAFISVSLIFSVWTVFSTPKTGESLSNPASKEGLLILTSWIFLALAIIIAIATVWPVLSAISGQKAMGLDASFYNKVCLPLATGLLILLCACPWMGWNSGVASLKKFYAALGIFLVSLAIIWFSGYRHTLPLLASAASIAALFTVAMRLSDRTPWHNRNLLGALGAHLGIAVLALGIAFSSSYTVDKELLLSRGQSESVGPYTITLTQVSDGAEAGYDYLRADLKISSDKNTVGVLSPERRMYAKFGNMQFSEVDVISSLSEDIYASLLGMDEDYKVLVKISLEPLVNWIWIGGVLLCILPLVGISAARKKSEPSGTIKND